MSMRCVWATRTSGSCKRPSAATRVSSASNRAAMVDGMPGIVRRGRLPGNGQAACEVVLGEAWRVRPDGKLIDELGAWLAPQNVQLVYGESSQSQ